MLFMKAIKITRDNSYIVGNEKHRIIETSYMNGDYPSIRKKYWDMKNTQRKREVPTADAIVKVEVVLAQPKGRTCFLYD